MSHSSREFHLIVDQLSQPVVDDAKTSVLDRSPCLVVPDGISYLLAPSGEAPRLLGDAERDIRKHAFLLEPVFSQNQPCLVLLGQTGSHGVRVNGQVAPRLAALREKDQVQFCDEFMLHVTLFTRPHISSVLEELVGKECPVCRVPFVSGVRVFACPTCASAMHLQADEEPEETRLECALAATECPVCRAPIEMTEGYRYEPELYSA